MTYPTTPGHTDLFTSREAARKITPSVANLRGRVLAVFQNHPDGLTADECASMLDLSVLAVRPRVTELGKFGNLERTTMKRPNASGLNARVWRAK